MGIFIILASVAVFILSMKYDLDSEKRVNVLVASKDILSGDIINESMIEYRTIRESDISPSMLIGLEQCVGSKASAPVKSGDCLYSYNLLPPDYWQENDSRILTLPMTVDERLANLIRKGSVINIKVLPQAKKAIPLLVLSKVPILDMLDENGLSQGDTLGNKKAFAILVLSSEQRDRVYAAIQYGKLLYELYCDSTQPADEESFVIPPEFYEGTASEQNAASESKGEIPASGGEG